MASQRDQDEVDGEPACYATLRVFAADLDPAEVESVLGVAPSASHRAGDVRSPGAAPYRKGGWFLSTRDAVRTDDLNEHLRYLVDATSASRELLAAMIARPDYSVDVFCFLLNRHGHGGFTLDADVIRDLGTLGLPLGLDSYGPYVSDFAGRSSKEILRRTRSGLNGAIRRPGMFGGTLAVESLMADMAWGQRRELDLQAAGRQIVSRASWTSTGVEGAFQSLTPDLPALHPAMSVLSDVCRRLDWLDLDDEPDSARYWRVSNGSAAFVSAKDSVLDDVIAEFGPPSIRIGNPRRESVIGYAGPKLEHPIVWFCGSGDDDRVVFTRVERESISEDTVFSRLGVEMRRPEPYPTDVLRGVPPPWGNNWFRG